MATLSDLAQSLQRRVGELSRFVPNETLGTGDGSKTIFYVKLPPVSSGSLSVYLDDSVQSESNYSVDLDFGRITFTTAPTSGQKVSVDYRGLTFHPDDLEDVVTEAVEDLELLYSDNTFTITDTSVDPNPTSAEKRLIVQQSVVNLLEGLSVRLASEAIRTASTGFSVDTTARANVMSRLIEFQNEKLTKLAERLGWEGAMSAEDSWYW